MRTKIRTSVAESDVYQLYDYARYMNGTIVPEIERFAVKYRDILSSGPSAENFLKSSGFSFDLLPNGTR